MSDGDRHDRLLREFAGLTERERGDRLRELAVSEPELAARLAQTLTATDTATTPVEFVTAPERVRTEPGGPDITGRRVGPYTLVERIGRGGMGVVYRARRADDSFDRDAAIKFLADAPWQPSRVEAFVRERRILALLDHPNIARLLDAGAIGDLGPYVIMELVEGEPIDRYCDRQDLDPADRLELFQKVCRAVQAAHQQLIVHRDIKPGNVLVDTAGEPKLLDFGIAKLLDPADDGTAGTRAMTPRYASPEQLAGGVVTTATDVYALGLVLFQMMAGRAPHDDEASTPHERQRAVLETDAPTVTSCAAEAGRPVEFVRALRGDIENIVAKALEREPGRRYGTAAALADDIQRHFDGLPILARAATPAYRARKFVRRHRVGVAVGGVVVLALATAALATWRQATIAEAARVEAERRNRELQRLAETLLFDVHEDLQSIPGTTDVRASLAGSASDYIGRLRQQARADPELAATLIAAYERVGDLLGNPAADNQGDRAGARARFLEGVAVCDELAELVAGHDDLAYRCLRLRRRAALMAYAASDLDEATRIVELALAEGRRLRERFSDLPQLHAEYANALGLLGEIHTWNGRSDDGIDILRQSIDEFSRLEATGWEPARVGDLLASTRTALAIELVHRERFDEGFREHREAVDLARRNHRSAPDDRDRLRSYWYQLTSWTNSLVDGPGEPDELRRVAPEMLALARTMREADPDNDLTRSDLATTTRYYARAMGKIGRPDEAIRAFEEAIDLYRSESRGAPDRRIALATIGIAEAHEAQEQRQAACAAYADALATWEALGTAGTLQPADGDWPHRVREARSAARCP